MSVIDRIRSKDATVAIVGMGRVGLPLGIAFAQAGLRVMGLDDDETRRHDGCASTGWNGYSGSCRNSNGCGGAI